MQIKISITLTGLLIKLQNIMINRFNLNTVGATGERGEACNQMYDIYIFCFQVKYGHINPR